MRKFFVMCAFLWSVAAHVVAEQDMSIWVSSGGDSNDSRNTSIDWIWHPDDKTNFNLGIGRSSIDVRIRNMPEEQVDTGEFRIGFDHEFFQDMTIGMGYEYWGRDQEIISQTLDSQFDWWVSDWSLGFALELRKLTLYGRLLNSRFKNDITSRGFGPRIAYLGTNWNINFNAKAFDYSEDPARLNTLRAYVLLGARTFNLASDLNDWQVNFSIEYQFTSWSIGPAFTLARSAIDDQRSNSYSLLTNIDITRSFSLSLEAGTIEPETGSNTDFATLSLGFHF